MSTSPLVILGADARASWNRVRRGSGAARRSVIAFLLVSLLMGPFVLGLSFLSGLILARTGADPVGALTGGFAALVVLITGLGLSTVINAFFADRTLLLYALAPVPPRNVFLARLVSSSLPAWLVGTTVMALIAGYGFGSDVGPGFYPVALLAVALTIFATVGLLVAVLSLVLRVVPARRARDVAALAAALIGAAFYAVWYGVVGGSQLRFGVRGLQRVAELGTRLDWLPVSWPARALAAWALGDPGLAAAWLGLMLAGSAATIGVAWLAYRSAFLVGVGVYGEGGAQREARPARRTRRRRVAEGPARPVLALAAKDLRTMRRDVRRLASVLPTVAMALVYPLVFFRLPGRVGAIGFWGSMVSGAFVPFLLSTAVALPAVGAEGRGMQLLVLAGVRAGVVLRAKLLYVIPSITLLGTLGGVVAVVTREATVEEKLVALALVAWISAGMGAIGVGAGAVAPNFGTSNPQRAVRFQASLLAMGAEAVFALLSLAAVLLFVLAGLIGGQVRLWLSLGALVPLAAGAVLVLGILALGSRRLGSWRPDEE